MQKTLFIITALLAAGFILGGCELDGGTGASGPEPGGSTTVTITPSEGGQVSYGAVTVAIPPDALVETTDITVGIPEEEPAYAPLPQWPELTPIKVNYVYQADPSGTIFSEPVQVTYEYDESDLGGYDENTLRLWTFANDVDEAVPLDGLAIDANNKRISGYADHFSYFLLTIIKPTP